MFGQIQKQHKYKAKSVEIDGIKFSSLLEGRFYTYFRDHGIQVLELQPRFLLQESFKHNGETIRKIEYIADFKIEYQGDIFYIDAKGMQTPVFDLKVKLWKKRYGGENYLLICKSIKELENSLNSL